MVSASFDFPTRGSGISPRSSARDVGVVIVRSAQLVMATAEEFQQILEELSRVRRFDEALKWQIGDAAPQQYLQIFLIEKRESNVGVAQQSVAIGMKGMRAQSTGHQFASRTRLIEMRIEDLANPVINWAAPLRV